MQGLSHILDQLAIREAQLQSETNHFDPRSFIIKDKAERLAKAADDDHYFAQEYFPDIFTIPFTPMHDEWSEIYNRRNREIHLVIGPRRFAKSAKLRASRIRKMINRKFRHGIRIGENLNDSEAELMALMLEFEYNPRLRHDYGELVNKRFWSKQLIVLSNGVSFKALSANVKARGITPEPDYVEIDDFEDQESARNRERGKDKLTWLINELYNATSKDATITWLANNLSIDSAANQFKEMLEDEPRPKFFCHTYKAIITNSEGHEASTWPQGWSIDELRELRDTIGTPAFEAEMQGNPMQPGDVFKHEWIIGVEYSDIERRKNQLAVGILLDPSYGESDSSCYKAIVPLVSDGKKITVLDPWIRQTSVRSMCLAWFEYIRTYRNWNLRFAKYEDTMNQKNLMRDFRDIAEEQKEPLMISGFADEIWAKTPKPMRIESLSAPIETGVINFVMHNGKFSKDMKRLIEQLMNYPKKPDDGPDAFASCYKFLSRMTMRNSDQPIYKTIKSRLRKWRN